MSRILITIFLRQRQQIADVVRVSMRVRALTNIIPHNFLIRLFLFIKNDTISTAGDDVSKYASHLLEVDLQDNLLFDWTEVGEGFNIPYSFFEH